MAKYRTDTRDVAPKIRKAKPPTPGRPPDGKLRIYDSQGRCRGFVGRKASAATVRRFGVSDAKLGTVGGYPAWVSARNVTGAYGAAKGSNK